LVLLDLILYCHTILPLSQKVASLITSICLHWEKPHHQCLAHVRRIGVPNIHISTEVTISHTELKVKHCGGHIPSPLSSILLSRSCNAGLFLSRRGSGGCWWLAPIILATWEAKIRRISVQGQSGQIVCETPISKIIRAKWIGGVAHMIECLFCKHEVLSSNPIPSTIFMLWICLAAE
jgi:hypothetical protein